jgi:hypothetical protein
MERTRSTARPGETVTPTPAGPCTAGLADMSEANGRAAVAALEALDER